MLTPYLLFSLMLFVGILGLFLALAVGATEDRADRFMARLLGYSCGYFVFFSYAALTMLSEGGVR